MIISKDLFIFGEQIFATIIPEGGNTQSSTQSSSQQEQHHYYHHQQQPLQPRQGQQQPAIVSTATDIITAAPTAARVVEIGAAEPVVELEPSPLASKLQTTHITAALATTTNAANGTLTKQETVAAVVVAAVGAAKKSNFKIQKNSKEELSEQQVVVPLLQKCTKLSKEKQQFQIKDANNCNEANSGKRVFGKKITGYKAKTKATNITSIPKISKPKATEVKTKSSREANGEGLELSENVKAAKTKTDIYKKEHSIKEEEEEEKHEEGSTDEVPEKEPLVKRNVIKLAAATATSTTTLSGTTATTPTPAGSTIEQQQQKHNLLLLNQRTELLTKQTDCLLQLEQPKVDSRTRLPNATTFPADPLIASIVSDPISVGGPAEAPIFNFNTYNIGKAMLPTINETSDHPMVTIPFISEQHRTLQLTFTNVNVLHNERKILSDVSGMVSPGELLAIMGPSGSGKTTLLDCISGQRRIDSGSIFLNRESLSKKWRRKIGYVLQEEVFFTSLTLRETVMYTALLRLPEKMPKAEKVKLVDRILQTLELNFCQHTKFGDYLNRGLSGGEKKRANIACELLTNPLLMLLDEPTSGLDSHSAISLMKVLKRYAVQEQKTVVISVHQPSSQMFHMFDKLLLLYNGRTAYFGEVNQIYRYFENIGVTIKPHYNPADFVLEQLKCSPDIREKLFVAARESHCNFLNGNCITVNTNNHNVQPHQNSYNNKQNGSIIVTFGNTADNFSPSGSVTINGKPHQHGTLINDIINNYYKDIRHNQTHSHPHHIKHDDMLTEVSCEEAAQHLWCGADSQSNFSSASSEYQQYEIGLDWLDYPTHFSTQFCVLSSRNFKEAKPRMLSKLNWFQTVGLALMAGAIWFQIPRTEEYLHDLQGWMFFSQTYWMLFALFGALNSFPSEREVISKERRSGAYRLSAYYLAKMCGELPLVVTLPTVYLMISYPMLGCTSFKLFFLMLVFLLLNTIVAQSVGFFIGACCMDMNVSITLSALYTLATQLFGGYLSSRIPEGLSWIRYTSMIHYAYQNMQILEFREGPEVRCGNPSSFEICKNNETTFIPYEEILRAQNSTSPLWVNTFILMMFFLVFRGLGYGVLRYIRCPKT